MGEGYSCFTWILSPGKQVEENIYLFLQSFGHSVCVTSVNLAFPVLSIRIQTQDLGAIPLLLYCSKKSLTAHCPDHYHTYVPPDLWLGNTVTILIYRVSPLFQDPGMQSTPSPTPHVPPHIPLRAPIMLPCAPHWSASPHWHVSPLKARASESPHVIPLRSSSGSCLLVLPNMT